MDCPERVAACTNDRLYAPYAVKKSGARVTVRARAFSDRQVQIITGILGEYSPVVGARSHAFARQFPTVFRIICENATSDGLFSPLRARAPPSIEFKARLCRRICGLMAEVGLNYPRALARRRDFCSLSAAVRSSATRTRSGLLC